MWGPTGPEFRTAPSHHKTVPDYISEEVVFSCSVAPTAVKQKLLKLQQTCRMISRRAFTRRDSSTQTYADTTARRVANSKQRRATSRAV